jgi:hypothetical protein
LFLPLRELPAEHHLESLATHITSPSERAQTSSTT